MYEKYFDLYNKITDLTEKTKYTRQHVTHIKNGTTPMPLGIAVQIHKDHNVPLWELVDELPKSVFESHMKFLNEVKNG